MASLLLAAFNITAVCCAIAHLASSAAASAMVAAAMRSGILDSASSSSALAVCAAVSASDSFAPRSRSSCMAWIRLSRQPWKMVPWVADTRARRTALKAARAAVRASLAHCAAPSNLSAASAARSGRRSPFSSVASDSVIKSSAASDSVSLRALSSSRPEELMASVSSCLRLVSAESCAHSREDPRGRLSLEVALSVGRV